MSLPGDDYLFPASVGSVREAMNLLITTLEAMQFQIDELNKRLHTLERYCMSEEHDARAICPLCKKEPKDVNETS